MTLNIDHYPNKSFALASFTSVFTIDLNQSVRERLKEREVLTNATALKIFKQIKLKSDILSFFAKSIVLIPLSIVIMTAGCCIPPTGALLAARVVVTAIGGGLLGYSLENHFKGFLPRLSQAYREQSQRAARYIKEIESAKQELRFNLARSLQL